MTNASGSCLKWSLGWWNFRSSMFGVVQGPSKSILYGPRTSRNTSAAVRHELHWIGHVVPNFFRYLCSFHEKGTILKHQPDILAICGMVPEQLDVDRTMDWAIGKVRNLFWSTPTVIINAYGGFLKWGYPSYHPFWIGFFMVFPWNRHK